MKRAATDIGAAPRGRSPHTSQARPRAVENAPAPRLWHRVATSAGTLQAKLTVNAPGDRFEEEADRVADQVLRMPEPAAGAFSSAPPAIQRKCAACEEEEIERGPLQAKESPGTTPSVPPRTESRIAAIKSTGGARLSPALRAYFEPRLGRDLSSVRLHAGADAQAAAREVRARAFTVGSHIAFAAGELRPDSTEGKRLLAHELVHTVQQGAAPGASGQTIQRQLFPPIPLVLAPCRRIRRPSGRVTPNTGIVVTWVGERLDVQATIQVSGPLATQAIADGMRRDIEQRWNVRFSDGAAIACRVAMTLGGPRNRNAAQIVVGRGTSVMESYTIGNTIYFASSGSPSDLVWSPAHEFGHLLGLSDRRRRPWWDFLETQLETSEPGYERNMMGAIPGGRSENRTQLAVESRNVRDWLDRFATVTVCGPAPRGREA